MAGKAVISLTAGLEDPEQVTVAFLVAVGTAESGRPTLMFQAKEAVRLALDGVAVGVACDGCPPLTDLLGRYEKAGGRYMVCPIWSSARTRAIAGHLPGPFGRKVTAPARSGPSGHGAQPAITCGGEVAATSAATGWRSPGGLERTRKER